MSKVLARWNQLPAPEAAQEILPCCGSVAWARAMSARRPILDEATLLAGSDKIWNHLQTHDWMEAFSKHPRIGERKAPQAASSQSASWSTQEQKDVAAANADVLSALAKANSEYEQKFNRVFIVCATGKSASEMLDILYHRLQNDDATELQAAAEEQRKITNIRLQKWLSA
jgi:2-oxo-4-hydroxy-4-carboxy-5-ureidoimidazoline decarboxylase